MPNEPSTDGINPQTLMSRNPIPLNNLGRKNLMALTGLFLCFFLVIHLAGNLQLLLPAERAQLQYNLYSELLSHNIIIKLISYLLYASILLHALYAFLLEVKRRVATGQAYAYDRRKQVSPWYRRQMTFLGVLLLVFLVVHMKNFWYVYKFGFVPLDSVGRKDLYIIVANAYKQWWYVLFYVICMLALGYHLWHGFYSAFQTLGLYHKKYGRWMKIAGQAFSVIVTAGFIFIPIYMYFKQTPFFS